MPESTRMLDLANAWKLHQGHLRCLAPARLRCVQKEPLLQSRVREESAKSAPSPRILIKLDLNIAKHVLTAVLLLVKGLQMKRSV